ARGDPPGKGHGRPRGGARADGPETDRRRDQRSQGDRGRLQLSRGQAGGGPGDYVLARVGSRQYSHQQGWTDGHAQSDSPYRRPGLRIPSHEVMGILRRVGLVVADSDGSYWNLSLVQTASGTGGRLDPARDKPRIQPHPDGPDQDGLTACFQAT